MELIEVYAENSQTDTAAKAENKKTLTAQEIIEEHSDVF